MGRGVNPSLITHEAAGVRYLGVYRLQDQLCVASYGYNNHPAEQYEEKITQVLLANATSLHPRLSVSDADIGTIHYETDQYAMYVAVTKLDYPQRTAFRCIRDFRSRFTEAFGEALHKAEAGGLTAATRPAMTELCTQYADPANADKTLGLIRQVDDVKGVMNETVQHMLATHENLEVLEDRSELLREQASTFQRTSRQVAVQAKRKNTKLCRIFCVLVVVAVVAIAAPFAVMHREEIEEWFRSMFPPEWADAVFGANETGSGEDYGSGFNGTVEEDPIDAFIDDVWEWRWPWES